MYSILRGNSLKKWRGAKESLDESEREEWKSWLKTQHSKDWDHGIQCHHFRANRWGKNWKQWETLFSWAPKSLQMVTTAMKLKDTCSLEVKLWEIYTAYWKVEPLLCWQRSIIVKILFFPVVGCESWTIKKVEHRRIDAFKLWCWRRLLRVPLGTSEANSRLFGKDPDAGKDWGQGEKGITEDKIVAWFHWLNRHEFEQTLRDSEGQGTLECCSSWDLKESDTT